MLDIIESWVVVTKNGSIMVKCPYCGQKTPDPSVRCEKCGKVVAMPKEIRGKKWW